MSWTDSVEKVLVTKEQIEARIAEMGAQITKDYEGKKLIVKRTLSVLIQVCFRFFRDDLRHPGDKQFANHR